MSIGFLLFLLIFTIPAAFAESTTSEMTIVNNRISFPNNEIILDNEPLKISEFNILEREFTKKVIFVTENNGNKITMTNSNISWIRIIFTDETELSASLLWDGTMYPPTLVATSGVIPSGYQTPNNVIKIGNDSVTITFDKIVTILLDDISEKIAYKQTGATNWNLISTCQGTYDTPTDPGSASQCSISDNVNTKILTYHFTEFAILEKETTNPDNDPPPTIKRGGGSSGHGRIGVNVTSTEFNDSSKTHYTIQQWIKHPIVWWVNGDITTGEFSSIIGWLIDKDILKIYNKIKPATPVSADMLSSTKHLFSMWEQDRLSDPIILDIIEKYRGYGIW